MTIKIPMQIAAQNLERICDAVDEGDLNEALQSIFNETRLDLANAVDRRIFFIELTKERIKTLKRLRDEFSAAAARMEFVKKRVEEGTLQVMNNHKDLPYKGELGRLKAQANSVARISLPEIKTTEASVRNIVDANDIKKHQIAERFYETKTYYTLVTEEIKKAIEAGEPIPWAKLERGIHLRIYK